MNKLDDYVAMHSSAEPEILKEVTRQTNLRVVNPRMISGHVQGRLLAMLTSLVKPRRVLELGTFTAYATIAMALEMDEGSELVTIEIDDELEDMAAEFIEKAGVRNIVCQEIGDAMEVMNRLDGHFDMVFIDADKRKYLDYYNLLFEKNLVTLSTLIIADNTIWDGKVLEETAKRDTQTIGIKEFNDFVAADPRVEKVMLPLRDGLTLIKVK